MKTRTMLVVALGLGLATAGCKKKATEDPGVGSAPAAGSDVGSAAAGSAVEPAKEAPKTGQDLAAAYLDCVGLINAGNFDDFKAKCLADTYVTHMVDGEDLPSADALIAMLKTNRTAMPDIKLEPQLVLVNGRNILAAVLTTGTHTGPLTTPMGEVAATNKKMGIMMFHRLAINEENKATEEWTFVDPATMMGQLGQMPKEAGVMRAAMETGMEGAPMIVVAADDDKEKANLDLVKQAGDAFNTKQNPFALYADDAVESDQAGSEDAKGKKEIEKGTAMLWKAFPDFKVTYGDMFAAGDYVVAFGQFTGTNTGPLGKMKKTGKPVSGQFAEIYKLTDGKIAQTWRFRSGLTMMAQLGMMPAPKAPAGAGSAAEPAKMKKGG